MTGDTASAEASEIAYHVRELEIARTPESPSHALPRLDASHRRVLDVGCGIGQTLVGLGLPRDGVTAVGVDVSEAALAYGRRSVAPDIAFVRAQGEALPFADGAFDLVVCRVALAYMHVPSALAAMARVLRPGGDLWLTLHPIGFAAGQLWRSVRARTPRSVVANLHSLASGATLHAFGRQAPLPFRRRYESFQTDRAMRRGLRAAGMDNVRISRGRHYVVAARRAAR